MAIVSEGCNDCQRGADLTIPTDGGKEIVIIPIPPITATKQSTSSKDIWTIGYSPDLNFTGSIGISAIATNPSGALYKSGTVALKGVEVTSVTLDWEWDDSISGGQVYPAQELDDVALGSGVVQNIYTGLTIVSTDGVSNDPSIVDRRFILVGSDGSYTKTIYTDLSFGNRIYYGEGVVAASEGEAITICLELADSVIKTTASAFSFNCYSLSPAVYPYIAVPVDLVGAGLAFKDANSALPDVDPMKLLYSNVEMTNGYNETELYNIYVGKSGSQRGAKITVK